MTILNWRWRLKNLTPLEATAANKQKAVLCPLSAFDCFGQNKTI